jgi:hypothetical protein
MGRFRGRIWGIGPVGGMDGLIFSFLVFVLERPGPLACLEDKAVPAETEPEGHGKQFKGGFEPGPGQFGAKLGKYEQGDDKSDDKGSDGRDEVSLVETRDIAFFELAQPGEKRSGEHTEKNSDEFDPEINSHRLSSSLQRPGCFQFHSLVLPIPSGKDL